MPQIGHKYVLQFDTTLNMVAATETLWLTARPASPVKQLLKVPQMEALYESAFLRVFATYENFLEDALTHYMAGYQTPLYTPVATTNCSLHASIKDATAALYGAKPFLLWHGPGAVAKRSQGNLVDCPVETVIVANEQRLEDLANIRHRIAHSSTDAKHKFEVSSRNIAGLAYASPGRLLRSPDISDPLNQPKWVRRIVDDLTAIVLKICP